MDGKDKEGAACFRRLKLLASLQGEVTFIEYGSFYLFLAGSIVYLMIFHALKTAWLN